MPIPASASRTAFVILLCLVAVGLGAGSAATQEQFESGDRFEPNDDFGNATTLDPGTYTGVNVTRGDVDFYAVELERGEALSASIAFSNDVGDLDFLLAGPDRTLRQASTSTNDTETLSYVASENGTYYLQVYGFANATGPYNLTVTTANGSAATGDRFEPNDDFGNATALSPGDYPGLNVTAGDVDYFAVPLDAGETLSASIAFSNEVGDLDFALAAPDGTVLQVSDGTADTETLSYVASENGTYYLVVYGYQGATGAYNLSVSTGG